jgi:hypothetical protein
MSKLIMAEGAAPDTPSTGKAAIFIDTSGRLALKDDDGNTDVHAALDTANAFTRGQTITPTSTSVDGLEINMPASTTARALDLLYNGSSAITVQALAGFSIVNLISRDMGNDSTGGLVQSGRNSSAGTEGPAAGCLAGVRAASGARYLWPDASSDWRTHTAQPTGSSGTPTVDDNAGTVVGTQTSHASLKENITEHEDLAELLEAVLAVKLYDYQMKEDGQRRADDSKQTYTGIVITDEDRQNNAWYANNLGRQQVPVLNERNLFGYLIGAIQAQQQQIQALQETLARLTPPPAAHPARGDQATG